jgi:hypothetical protein
MKEHEDLLTQQIIKQSTRLGGKAAIAVGLVTVASVATFLLASQYIPALRPFSAFWWTILIASEAVFALYYHLYKYALLNSLPDEHAPDPEVHDPNEIRAHFLRHLGRAEDVNHLIQPWFLNAAVDEIKRQNAAELFSYAIWYKTL